MKHTIVRKKVAIITLLLSIWASNTVYAQSSPKFAVIPLTLSENVSLPLGNEILLDVKVYDPDLVSSVLGQWRGIEVAGYHNGVLRLSISDNVMAVVDAQSPDSQYLANTFVIDYEEASVKAVTDAFLSDYGKGLKAEDEGIGASVQETKVESYSAEVGAEIEAFVANYITEPSYIHSFSFASTVAKSRSGDCTEYAVLSAALARALAIPARVVVGTIIVDDGSTVEAIGHAWNEFWFDGRWWRIDAAMYGAESAKTFYLPSHILKNEGPGYALSLSKAVLNSPESITVVKKR
ncbi:transglutaminase superfamily protein [Alteromonas sp. I10]|uniref:transglutaminase domain-containing protein n=1 Tax=Alteromonas TaxID=226 RepID=UPI000D75B2A8|nr:MULTISPECIES: transglutaminase domain-containing protein [Alteromonas]PXW75785.1 transglutaminase superfamily protein [Alteromonas sp. I10]